MPLRSPDGATFEDFDSCVNEISGEDTTKEEARRICSSFNEINKEDQDMSNRKLQKRVIEYYEDFEDTEDIEKTEDKDFEIEESELIKADEEKQIAYSIILKADRPDLEKDIFPAPVVEKMAHRFMDQHQDHNLEHEFDTEKVQLVESFIAPSDFDLNGHEIKKGDWVGAIKFHDDKLWQLAKDGKLNGFSIEGKAKKTPLSEVKQ